GLSLLQRETITADDLRAELAEPYFVPSGTPVFRQLQFFQESRRRFALMVDEYGELQGLLTRADIVEELVGAVTSSSPSRDAGLRWNERGEVQVEGSVALRDLNRQLDTNFPLDGPRTLNGLILETLRELPEADVGLRFGNIGVVVTHIEDRTIRSARLQRLDLPAGPGDEGGGPGDRTAGDAPPDPLRPAASARSGATGRAVRPAAMRHSSTGSRPDCPKGAGVAHDRAQTAQREALAHIQAGTTNMSATM